MQTESSYSHGGVILLTKMTKEVKVDREGWVLKPKEIRDKIGLKPGRKARLKIENESITITAPVSPEEFIKELEGCITEGVPTIDHLKLKNMWEPAENRENRT